MQNCLFFRPPKLEVNHIFAMGQIPAINPKILKVSSKEI